ncbi:hypothetical protein [endosymbiont DhMRE of Dentiscutata heterogama]|uniref:hypothetical protein n=1 Tax=endosymbiont DhMRE of Dentiscutata heterogama TaxID=1609546 RepID=UPI0018A815E6|nr:hypothetical protein [endosymbiont DhMRE of Dentiscutata heterogama]
MEISQNIQEVVAYTKKTNSWKKNKENKLKSQKKERKHFAFLVYLFFNLILIRGGEYFCLTKSPP